MSPERDHADGGCRDCGRFFIDVIGQFQRGDVRVAWREESREIPPALERHIEETWLAEAARAAKDDVLLYDGQLCRLIEFEASAGRLSLTLGRTSYKEFLATNLMGAHLLYTHGADVLANPLGVSTAVTTSDGFLLLGRRSQKVVYNPGRIHPIGGIVEAGQSPSGLPDPFESILQELRTEANVTPDLIGEVMCLGLVRDKRIIQPELVFDATLKVDAPALRKLASQAAEAQEHDNLILLMNYPSSVVTFMENHSEVLTPVATATLLLHGLRHWGSGWFTSARGYLQSVV
jgi:hypothetical protein